ncbi:MAG: M90 family metallopeptidase [Burkholderiaceae bacterium]
MAVDALPLSFLIFTGLALAFVLWLLGRPWWVARRRACLREQPFPAHWRSLLQQLPLVRQLPADLQLQLKAHMQVFLAEKPMLGCNGLEVTDAMRIAIAAQACLLLLNRNTDYYPKLRQILVYPGPFIVNRQQSVGSGVMQDLRQVLSGESWSQGQVVLSWQDVQNDSADANDGRNVVIHEFAHQLDQESGQANGAPLLRSRSAYRHWTQVFGQEFAHLQQRVAAGNGGLLSDYGATNPGEFFAVASEVFFEQAQQMADQHPALFAQLRDFYAVDPLSW